MLSAGRVRRGMSIVAEYDPHKKIQRWKLLGWKEFLKARDAAQEERPAADTGTVVTLPAPGERQSPGRKATRKPPPGEG